MGTMKRLRFIALCFLTTPLVSVPSITIREKFGASTLMVGNALTLAASLTNEPFMVSGEIINKTNATQAAWARIEQGALNVPMIVGITSSFKGARWTENTATDKTFSLTAQFSGLSLGTTLSVEYVDVELS